MWLALAGCSLSAVAGTNVGVSIGVSQPGFYGRIDLGGVAAPHAVTVAVRQIANGFAGQQAGEALVEHGHGQDSPKVDGRTAAVT